jgi:hypothetical protein
MTGAAQMQCGGQQDKDALIQKQEYPHFARYTTHDMGKTKRKYGAGVSALLDTPLIHHT